MDHEDLLPGERALPWSRRLRTKRALLAALAGAVAVAAGGWLVTDRLGIDAHRIAASASASAAGCEAAEGSTCAVPTGARGQAAVAALPPGTARLVEFTSEHCPACTRMAPVMARLERACASKPESIMRISLDDDRGRGLAEHYGVRALPTFMVVDTDGSEVERFVGEHPEAKLALAVENVRGEACVER